MMLSEILQKSDSEEKFVPTPQWMSEMYTMLNRELFDNLLGPCTFGIFTTGKGSEGRTLGRFSCGNRGKVRYSRRTRQLFVEVPTGLGWETTREYLNRDNFAELFKPHISLNGNYSGTEHSWLLTLVHEMCHYYVYKDGLTPYKHHGPEFMSVARMISSRSGGYLTVDKVATAEDITGKELNDEMKARRAARVQRRLSDTTIYLAWLANGEVRMMRYPDSKTLLVTEWNMYQERKGALRIIGCNNSEAVEYIVGKGYKKMPRTVRWWVLPPEMKRWAEGVEENYGAEVLYEREIKENKNKKRCRITESQLREMIGKRAGHVIYEEGIKEDRIMKAGKKIRLSESRLRSLIKESVGRILAESILDNLCLMVQRDGYGRFWLRDTGTFRDFTANAWMDGNGVQVSIDSDDRVIEQMSDSEAFIGAVVNCILDSYPENIEGFDEYIERTQDEGCDYDEALQELYYDGSYDTYEKKVSREKENMRNSGDWYSTGHGF